MATPVETQANASFGTIISVGNGTETTPGDITSETYSEVAEIHDISGPGIELSTIEATHHLSPDATREHMASLKDLTDLSFEIAFLPQNAKHSLSTGFLKDWKDRTRRSYRIEFTDPDGTMWYVKGFVTGFELGAPVEGLLTASVTIKLTGTIVETTTP